MKQNILTLLTAMTFALNTGCIHTRSHETKSVEFAGDQSLEKVVSQDLEISYLVYQPSKLPLNDFFSNLKKGDYNEAFHRIDITYYPTNFNDPALEELVEAGFIPTYVRVKNTGTSVLELDEKRFALVHNSDSIKAFYSDFLPREFKHFSPKAVAANIFNTGAVMVGFAAVMAVLIGSNINASTNQNSLNSDNNSLSINSNNNIYNDTSETVNVDYKNYLIHKTQLAPGDSMKGLLFFYNAAQLENKNYKLVVTP